MLLDITDIQSDEFEADVCIVGAGAAGIGLARQFIGSSIKVVLLEAGGLEYEEDTQALYRGESEGLMYFPLSVARLRYFGGSTGHWGGANVPMVQADFEKKDWLPSSGWPFNIAELEPYYPVAQEICAPGPYDYTVKTWSDPETSPPLPLDDTVVESQVVQSDKPRRFGTYFRKELEAAKNIHVILHANVLEFVTDKDKQKIVSAEARNIGGKQLNVKAKEFILCAGGIETPRLLLLSNRQMTNGLGNHYDLVGRYFMEHLFVVDAGQLALSEPRNMKLYEKRTVDGTKVRAGLGLTQDTLRKHKLMNSWLGFKLKGAPKSQQKKSSYNYIKRSLKKGEIPEDFWRHVKAAMSDLSDSFSKDPADDQKKDVNRDNVIEFSVHAEQAPNPDSRVYLGDDTDSFGQRRLKLDWRLQEIDHASIRRTLAIMAKEFGAAGLGRFKIALGDQDDVWTALKSAEQNNAPVGSFHHIGTTRMHDDPKQGVVDANLKMHDLANLYVSSSSVFPTSGFANPTLTIVALSCRLADHIKKKLGSHA
jgi:choline dehydrogenase-like flavoprotein